MQTLAPTKLERWEKTGDLKERGKTNGLSLWAQDFINPTTGETKEFSIFKKQEGIAICSVTEKGNLLLVRQYKHGVDNFILGFPAGIPDKEDRSKEETAARELKEETGYEARTIKVYGPSHLMPGKSPCAEYAAVALGCRWVDSQRLDENEDKIEVIELPKRRVFTMVREGVITSAPTRLSLFMAMLHGDI